MSRVEPAVDGRALAAAAIALTALPLLLHLRLLQTRGFGPDEFEHSHFAWCISHGMVPYRDYFEHHTPLLHYLLQPLFRFIPAERSGEDAFAFLIAARRLMWGFTAAILALTYGLARRVGGAAVACAAVVLLLQSPIFLDKTIEVRPDVPATALLVAGVLSAAIGLGRARGGAPGSARALGTAGALLGVAFLFTQKVLFAAPGLGAACLWLALGARRRAAPLGALAAGAALPVAVALLVFWRQGALAAFWFQNFVVNARWPGLGAREFVLQWVREDPALVALGAAGLVLQLRRVRDAGAKDAGEPLVALTALAMVAALAVHPAVTFHYFLMLLPFVAIAAGRATAALARALLRAVDARPEGGARRAAAIGAALSALVWAHTVVANRDPLRTRAEGAVLAAALAALLAWTLARRAVAAVTAALLLLLAPPALLRLHASLERGNWAALQGLRYVERNSAPWETVLDGFTGLGAFRPHPFFHPFQYGHTLAIETAEERAAIVDDLRSGRALPKLVLWNYDLDEGSTPELREFLLSNYVPSGLEPIRVRPFDNHLGFWDDEAPRPFGWVRGQERAPHVIFDDRWEVPGEEAGVAVRRSRPEHAGFVVPMRHPRAFRVTLRALADARSQPAAVELVVNRHSAGAVPGRPGLALYEYDVAGPWLVPGFNAFELRFAGAPGATLAVESLKLSRP